MSDLRRIGQAAAILALLVALPLSAAELAVLQNGFSIRHDSRQAMGTVTRLHTGSGFVDIPSDQISGYEPDDSNPPAVPAGASAAVRVPAPLKPHDINDLVSAASGRHRVDPDLIASVIHAESSFNPRAVSPKGAQGLMQLMPQTATRLGVQDAFEPNANVDAGTRYLRELLLRYNGDMAKALAAYNAGPRRVEQYRGVPPYRETHAYVARVIRDFNRKKLASEKAAIATANPQPLPARKQSASRKQAETTKSELRTISTAGASR